MAATRLVYRIQDGNGKGPWTCLHDMESERFNKSMVFGTNRKNLKFWMNTLIQESAAENLAEREYAIFVYRVPLNAIHGNPRGNTSSLYHLSGREIMFDLSASQLLAMIDLENCDKISSKVVDLPEEEV